MRLLKESCSETNKVTPKECLHKFRNTFVSMDVLEQGKPCGRFYHSLRKYYGLYSNKEIKHANKQLGIRRSKKIR